jgi:hypothetical protein
MKVGFVIMSEVVNSEWPMMIANLISLLQIINCLLHIFITSPAPDRLFLCW